MDYIGILKRAWNVTWKYKILWLFGLFAGAGGGSGSGNYNPGSGNTPSGPGSGTDPFANLSDDPTRLLKQLEPVLPIVIAVAVLLFLIGILFFVLSFAAQGGLIHLVNEEEEGRPVRAGDGWSVGFHHWGRVFWLEFLMGIPVFVVVVVFLLIFGVGLVGTITGFSAGDKGAAAGIASLGGMCFGIGIFAIVATVLGVVIGVVLPLALRYAVLEDRPAWTSIMQGWADLKAKRGGFLMYLVIMVTGLVYGIAVGVVMALVIAPSIVLLILGNYVAFVILVMLSIVLAMIPAAIYGAFVSTAWTIFFRRMTGREVVASGVPAPPSAYSSDAAYPPPIADAPTEPQATADPWVAAHAIPGEPPPPPAPEPPLMPEPPAMPEPPPLPEPPESA